MKISIFCEGKTVDFEVEDSKAAIFISSTKEYLKSDEYASSVYGHKRYSDEELEAMSVNELMRIVCGSMDYNSWHKHTRHISGHEYSYSEEYEQCHMADKGYQESPEEILIKKEEEEAVKKYLFKILPESQAEVYYLKEIEGLEFHEIAEYLNDKLTNVSHRFYRAKKRINKIKNFYKTPSNFCSSSGYFSESKKIPKEKNA